MVHTKLIQEGKVQPLTYSQLRRIEKIDAKKARDLALIDAGKTAISAGGNALAGLSIGLGNAFNGYLSGDAIAFAEKSTAGLLFLAWLTVNYPGFARFTHLDRLALGAGAGPPPPGVQPPNPYNPPGMAPGQWKIVLRYVGPYGPVEFTQYYSTRDKAETAISYYTGSTGGSFILISGPDQVP